MASKYIIYSDTHNEYLAKHTLGRYYMTSDITKAMRFHNEKAAKTRIREQDIVPIRCMSVITADFK